MASMAAALCHSGCRHPRAEDATPNATSMLAKLACNFIWLEDARVVNVQDGVDGTLRLLSSPDLRARNTFGQGHLLFLPG